MFALHHVPHCQYPADAAGPSQDLSGHMFADYSYVLPFIFHRSRDGSRVVSVTDSSADRKKLPPDLWEAARSIAFLGDILPGETVTVGAIL